MNAFIRAEWFYFGKQYFDLANQQVQSSYQLLNASIGISSKIQPVLLLVAQYNRHPVYCLCL